MRKVILLITITITLFVNKLSYAQTPKIDWQKCYGGSNYDQGIDITSTSDGGYIAVGSSSSNNKDVTINNGSDDYWIVKINSQGIIEWQRTLGGTALDVANSIQQTADGAYIVAGFSSSNNGDVTSNSGSIDYWIIKLNSSGSISWQKSYGGSKQSVANCIKQTSDLGYIIAGSTYANDGDVTNHKDSSDYWIVKTNSVGTIQWEKTFGGNGKEEATYIEQTSDDGYIITGFTHSNDLDVTNNHGKYDYWVIKINSSGILEWQKTFGGTDDDKSYYVKQTTTGEFIVAGYTSSTNGNVTVNNGKSDYWIVKLDVSGNLIWQKSFGGNNDDYANSIEETSDKNYIISGTSSSINGNITMSHGGKDCWIVKINVNGGIIWQKSIGGTNDEHAFKITQTTDENYILIGDTQSTNSDISENKGMMDFLVVKLTSEYAGIETVEIDNSFNISPNPANNVLKLSSDLPISKFQILDLNGRILNEILDEDYSNSFVIDLTNFIVGSYFIELVSDKKVIRKCFMKI